MLVSIHMPAGDILEEESEVDAMDADITLSVRELVEFVLKEGSIDSRFQPRSSMLTGTRLHQKLQRRYEDPEEKEVHLKGEKVVDGIFFLSHFFPSKTRVIRYIALHRCSRFETL